MSARTGFSQNGQLLQPDVRHNFPLFRFYFDQRNALQKGDLWETRFLLAFIAENDREVEESCFLSRQINAVASKHLLYARFSIKENAIRCFPASRLRISSPMPSNFTVQTGHGDGAVHPISVVQHQIQACAVRNTAVLILQSEPTQYISNSVSCRIPSRNFHDASEAAARILIRRQAAPN